jgi:hypothetical protein
MYRSKSYLFATAGLALALTFAISSPSNAQPSDDGTGAGSGNSPPIDDPRAGTAVPDGTAPMDTPPMPTDDSAGQAAPQENNAAAPEENKTPGPGDGTKKGGLLDPD